MATIQAETLRDLWIETVVTDCPSQLQFERWLALHGESAVQWAVRELSSKQSRLQRNGRGMDYNYKIRFVSSILNSKAKTQEAR
jgi:hypothetical protein